MKTTRGASTRRRVLEGALELIDRNGNRGLTVRALAAHLGVAPMTLYSYFKSKEELLDLAFEELVRRLLQTHRRDTWQEECTAVCRHVRSVLLAHPNWVPLLTRATAPGPALDAYEKFFKLMSRDRFQAEATMFSISSAMAFTLGAVLVERMMIGSPPVPVRQLALVSSAVADAPSGAYPRIEAASKRFEAWSFDEVFESGLRAFVAGLEGVGRRRLRMTRLADG